MQRSADLACVLTPVPGPRQMAIDRAVCGGTGAEYMIRAAACAAGEAAVTGAVGFDLRHVFTWKVDRSHPRWSRALLSH